MFHVNLQGFAHWYWWSFFFFKWRDFGMKATFIVDRKRQHFGMDSHNWKHLATLPRGDVSLCSGWKWKEGTLATQICWICRWGAEGMLVFDKILRARINQNEGWICKMTSFPPNVWIRAVAKLVADDVVVFSLDTSGVWKRGRHHDNYSRKTNMPPENQPIPSMHGIFTYRTNSFVFGGVDWFWQRKVNELTVNDTPFLIIYGFSSTTVNVCVYLHHQHTDWIIDQTDI